MLEWIRFFDSINFPIPTPCMDIEKYVNGIHMIGDGQQKFIEYSKLGRSS